MFIKEKEMIIKECLIMQEKEYFIGTWGNISVRCGNHIIITPSRISYDEMKADDLVVLHLDGSTAEGQHPASSEKEVHRQIYLERPDVKAIIHAHTESAMSVSSLEINEVPCVVEEMSQLLGGTIPLTSKYVPAEHHQELGSTAANAIGKKNAVLLRNHGPVACGRNLTEADLVVKVVEKSCQIYLNISPFHKLVNIPEKYIQSERQRFLYKYGNEQT